MPAMHRRAVRGISWSDTKLDVKQQFKEPNTDVLRFWLSTAPWLCFILGLVLTLVHGGWDFYEYRRDNKIHVRFLIC